MKKMIVFLLIAVMVLAAPVSVYAAEVSLNPGDQKDIDVYAKYTLSLPEKIHLSQIIGGKAAFTTASGASVVIAFSGNNYGYSAYLIELTEADKDAYSWLSEIIGGGEFTAYCVVFKDENGNTVNIEDTFTVTVTKPQGYGDVIVYTINAAGNKNTASVSTQDGKLVFALFGSNYFAIADKNNSGGDKPGDLSQTGDNSNMNFWLLLGGAALTVLGSMTVMGRKKRYRASSK